MQRLEDLVDVFQMCGDKVDSMQLLQGSIVQENTEVIDSSNNWLLSSKELLSIKNKKTRAEQNSKELSSWRSRCFNQ